MKILREKKLHIFKKIIGLGVIFLLFITFVKPVSALKCVDENGNTIPCPNQQQSGANNTNNTPAGANNTNNTPAGANNTNNTPSGANNINNTPAGANNTGTGSGLNIKTGINNPLSSDLDTIPKFIMAILNFVLMIGVPIVTLAIIYAGFLFVTATGNSEKLKKAKQALIYTLVGAALLLGSLVISNAIKGTVDEIKSANNQ